MFRKGELEGEIHLIFLQKKNFEGNRNVNGYNNGINNNNKTCQCLKS